MMTGRNNMATVSFKTIKTNMENNYRIWLCTALKYYNTHTNTHTYTHTHTHTQTHTHKSNVCDYVKVYNAIRNY